MRRKVREAKEDQKRREWEAKTKERNQQYVVGSLRRGTGEDVETVGHNHGWVCEVTCRECGCKRVVNKQDAFQAVRCKECQKTAKKAKRKAKRKVKAKRKAKRKVKAKRKKKAKKKR